METSKKIFLFNIDSIIRQSTNQRKLIIDAEDVELRMFARRRLVKLSYMGYTLVGFSIQPDLETHYRYEPNLFRQGVKSMQRKLGPGKLHQYFLSTQSTKHNIDDKIIYELKSQLNIKSVLLIADDGRDLDLSNHIGAESVWSTKFFAELDQLSII